MIILSSSELSEAIEAAFAGFYVVRMDDEEKWDELAALKRIIIDKIADSMLKYPHPEWKETA
jgi:hypothetical protein